MHVCNACMLVACCMQLHNSLSITLLSQAQQAANDARLEGKRRVGPAADGVKQGVDQAQQGFEQGADQAAGAAAKQVCPKQHAEH